MRRSLIQRALVALLFAALLAPVLEAFDSWDSSPGLARDTEFHVAEIALATGLSVAVIVVASHIARLLTYSTSLDLADYRAASPTAPLLLFSPESPPSSTPLRI
jgi:hypothetical protein